MPHNTYPNSEGREGDPSRTPEQAFDGAFNKLSDHELIESPLLSVRDVDTSMAPQLAGAKIRVLQARTPVSGMHVNMTVQTVGGGREVTVDIENPGNEQLLTVTYDETTGPTGEVTVMAQAIRHRDGRYAEADAAFLQAVGFGEIALASDQTQAATPDMQFTDYFPDAAEVARLGGLPEATNVYQG